MGHGTCIYVCVYINAIENGVMLQLYSRHEFCNITLKMIRKVYIVSGSAPPPMKNCECAPAMEVIWSASCLSLEKQVPSNGVPQRGSGPVGSEITRTYVVRKQEQGLFKERQV